MVVVIPAYEPNEELEKLVSELNCMNYRIVIVNDGSSPDKNVIFERLKDKATILHHTVNYGKAEQLKQRCIIFQSICLKKMVLLLLMLTDNINRMI